MFLVFLHEQQQQDRYLAGSTVVCGDDIEARREVVQDPRNQMNIGRGQLNQSKVTDQADGMDGRLTECKCTWKMFGGFQGALMIDE